MEDGNGNGMRRWSGDSVHPCRHLFARPAGRRLVSVCAAYEEQESFFFLKQEVRLLRINPPPPPPLLSQMTLAKQTEDNFIRDENFLGSAKGHGFVFWVSWV